MAMDHVLQKTNRINLLFDIYANLLTERQQTFLQLYYHDNLSLAEIAEQFAISRQAINEHIKRAEAVLEQYEEKLQLLVKHERRMDILTQLKEGLQEVDRKERDKLQHWVEQLIHIELG